MPSEDFLADQVIRRVLAVVGVELDHRAENVRIGLVQAAGFAGVDEVGGAGVDAMAHLVASDVERDQRAEVYAVAVAVGHAEAGIVPEGVVVAATVVHAAVGGLAVVGDAEAAVHVLEVVPGHRRAVLGVGSHRGLVGDGVVAPDVVGVLVDLAEVRLLEASMV